VFFFSILKLSSFTLFLLDGGFRRTACEKPVQHV
jgi:hypothetical protein